MSRSFQMDFSFQVSVRSWRLLFSCCVHGARFRLLRHMHPRNACFRRFPLRSLPPQWATVLSRAARLPSQRHDARALTEALQHDLPVTRGRWWNHRSRQTDLADSRLLDKEALLKGGPGGVISTHRQPAQPGTELLGQEASGEETFERLSDRKGRVQTRQVWHSSSAAARPLPATQWPHP